MKLTPAINFLLSNFLFLPMLFTPYAWAEETITIHETKEKITIDGDLSESGWQTATPVTNFVRFIPTDGGPPPGKTEVRLLQDEKNIYIGILVADANYPIQARVSPREDVNDDDQVGIYIDTIGDGRTGYIFYLNPLGVQQDIRYSNGNWMMRWNTIFTTQGKVTEDGYVIEMALPFKSLQYPDDGKPNWRIMFTRKIPSEGAKYSSPKMRRGHPQMFLQALPLTGLKPSKQGAGIQIQPTLSGLHTMTKEDENLEWVGFDPWINTLRPSLDFRLGITPETAVSLTILPDFSQVEGDVRQINLNQRFAFFYPEQRPFFLANIDAFQDNAATLYTRSIVDPLTGLKFAGKEGAWDFAILNGIDQNANASVQEFGAAGFSSEELQGHLVSTSYFRVRKDALNAGFIGMFFADKRVLSQQSPFAEDYQQNTNGYNDVLGADIRTNFGKYGMLTGHVSGSIVGNDDTQEIGSQEYISISRSPDLGAGYRLGLTHSTPEYRKEMGFQNQSGLVRIDPSAHYIFQLGANSIWTSRVSASVQREFDDDNSILAGTKQELNLSGIHKLGFNTGWYIENYQQARADGPYLDLFWNARLGNKLSTKLSGKSVVALDYGTLQESTSYSARADILWRPLSNLRADVNFIQQWYQLPDIDMQNAQRIYARLNWQFTKFLGTRIIQQSVASSETERPSFFASALLSYMKSPGNEFYIGGTWNINGEEALELQEQMIFVKWTQLFRY